MEKIIWDENFSVGVREMDKQHKELIRIINKLIESNNITVDSIIISETLVEMAKYARYHFKTEEQFLIAHNYSDYSMQKNQHTAFMKKTIAFFKSAMAYEEGVPTEILVYLKTWIINHILQTDMKYKSLSNEKALK